MGALRGPLLAGDVRHERTFKRDKSWSHPGQFAPAPVGGLVGRNRRVRVRTCWSSHPTKGKRAPTKSETTQNLTKDAETCAANGSTHGGSTLRGRSGPAVVPVKPIGVVIVESHERVPGRARLHQFARHVEFDVAVEPIDRLHGKRRNQHVLAQTTNCECRQRNSERSSPRCRASNFRYDRFRRQRHERDIRSLR